jgi:hypothetical protein
MMSYNKGAGETHHFWGKPDLSVYEEQKNVLSFFDTRTTPNPLESIIGKNWGRFFLIKGG